MKKILIVGATGLIGSHLYNFFKKKKYFVIGTSTKKKKNYVKLNLNWPLNKWPNLENISNIIVCAGITNILQCEKKISFSRKINIDGLKKILKKYKKLNTHVTFLSSTSVFDGKKLFFNIHDKLKPINEYGRQKKICEKIILNNNGLIIRTAKVVDTLSDLLNQWKKNLSKNISINPFKDICTALITKKNISDIIFHYIKENKIGVLHLSSSDEISYKEIAYILCNNLKKKNILVKEINVPLLYKKHITIHASLKNNYFVNLNTKIKSSTSVLQNFLINFL